MKPKISIVTPSFNQGRFLEQTINSVLDQGYPNLEYIIIDGGSIDNSVEIIKKYGEYLKYWISEKDKGQANAINKGLKHCTGEIFNWLNSDDYLEKGALNVIADSFDNNTDMVAGTVRVFDKEKTLEIVHHKNLSAKGLMYWLPGVSFVQPGVWMRRRLIEASGGIDEQYHYSFDWDIYIRYLFQFPKVKYIDNLLVHFRYHDASKTVNHWSDFNREEFSIVEKLSHSRNDGLKKLAMNYLSARKVHARSNEILASDTMTRIEKTFNLLKELNYQSMQHWRVVAGAIRQNWKGGKKAD